MHSCPPLLTKCCQKVRRELLLLKTWLSVGDNVPYNHLRCGKLQRKSSRIAQFPVGSSHWSPQSASLRRHARCPLPSSVFAHANVLSWNVFIITKLIRGCGWLTPHIWLNRIGEMWPLPRQGHSIDTHIPGLFSYPRANTQTHRLLVSTWYFSLNVWLNELWWLCLSLPPPPQVGNIIIFYKDMNVHIHRHFLVMAVILARYIMWRFKTQLVK